MNKRFDVFQKIEWKKLFTEFNKLDNKKRSRRARNMKFKQLVSYYMPWLDGDLQDIKDLQNALSIGDSDNSPQGSALQVEDLEATLKNVTYDECHLKLNVPKLTIWQKLSLLAKKGLIRVIPIKRGKRSVLRSAKPSKRRAKSPKRKVSRTRRKIKRANT